MVAAALNAVPWADNAPQCLAERRVFSRHQEIKTRRECTKRRSRVVRSAGFVAYVMRDRIHDVCYLE